MHTLVQHTNYNDGPPLAILIMGHRWVDPWPRAGPCLISLILTQCWPSAGTLQGHHIISDVGPTSILSTLVQYWLWSTPEGFNVAWRISYRMAPILASYWVINVIPIVLFMFKGLRKFMDEIWYLKVPFTAWHPWEFVKSNLKTPYVWVMELDKS